MAIRKTEAFVIKTQPFRSSSLIVTLFTRDFGKIRGIAKGVRKEREMRGALFELFTHADIIFYEKIRSELHLISEASIIDSFDVLRTRLDTIAYASYFAELVEVLTEVQDPHESIFCLLEVCFRYLPAIPGEKIARLFEVKLLSEIGWLPHLNDCLQCRESVPEAGFFSVSQGGVLCVRCSRAFADARPLSAEALRQMRFYTVQSLEEAIKRPAPGAAEQELKKLMEHFLLYRLSGALKSRQFMDSIQPALLR